MIKKLLPSVFIGVLPLISLIGCSAEQEQVEPAKEIAQYSVEFLVKQENTELFKNLVASCKAELATGKSIEEVMSDPNCSNAEIAAQQRSRNFNKVEGTRRESTRAFSDSESTEVK